MLGTFENDNPYIEIEVKGVVPQATKIKALVDTGFNGYLTLPYLDAFPLGLVLRGVQTSTLADGSTSNHFVCIGEICLDGKCITTTIDIHPGGMILLGTKLLKEIGKVIVVDCCDGKIELIDKVPTPPPPVA